MACIIPQRIINRHYVKIANEQKEDVYLYSDRDDFYIDVPCGRCINCLNSYMTKWRTRLFHEYEYMSSDARLNSYFITLTFNDKTLKNPKFFDEYGNFDVYKCKYRFIDRIRKKYGSSPRYFIITEYGEKKLRLHLHGIIFDCNFDINELSKLWSYGFVDYSPLKDVDIKYVTSYITKYNEDVIVDPKYIQRVFCSPGLGKQYCSDSYNIKFHHPKDGILNPILLNSNQQMVAMPRYYRQKIFTPDELEDMKLSYFSEMSDDVIPDPPYRIGKKFFIDYTLYLKECQKYKSKFNKLYRKSYNYGFKSITTPE